MANLDSALGTQLVGTWIITALYVLELTWAVQYCRHASSQDGLYLRSLVAVTMIIDLAGLLGAQANVYLYCVSHWGDAEYIQHQYWPVPYCFITGIITDAIVQGFLVGCYLRLSKNWIVGSAFIVLILVTCGSGLSVAILAVKWSEVEQRLFLVIPLKLWLIMDVVTNICISGSLAYRLYSKRTGLKTETMIRHLIILSLQSAMFPAFCAIAALVAFLVRPDTNISAIFLWILPRAYVLSMLYTLNIRQSVRKDIGPGNGNATDLGRNQALSGVSLTPMLRAQAPLGQKDDHSALEMNSFT